MSSSSLSPPEDQYFDYPYSIDPLPDEIRRGLIPVSIFALLSIASTVSLLAFLTFRLVTWRRKHHNFVGYNQYVLLIYNLLLADLQQSMSFAIGFHWLRENRIVAPTAACFIQGWLVHIGDVSSGAFIMAIAAHTWFSVVRGRRISYSVFVSAIIGCWAFALLMTVIGPALYKGRYFVRAGAWCWVAEEYEAERLWLHYLWIFIVEFGVILFYGLIFFYLHRQLSHISSTTTNRPSPRVQQAARYMVLYPIAYCILTLPLAAGRMASMSGRDLPYTYWTIAGSFMTSCGWIDALLYTLTRRVLISGETGAASSRDRNTAQLTGFEFESVDRAGARTQRTVVITGGQKARDSAFGGSLHGSRIQRHPGSATRHGHGHGHGHGHKLQKPSDDSLLGLSPAGSTDSIIKAPPAAFEGVKAETKVEVRIERATDISEEPVSESDGSSSAADSKGTKVKDAGFQRHWE
ncbi:G protein-coupled glucose receptor regulating Gpa2-domain-containing protein [Lineolata rhizophorae]|uniref:G protein-coupled glucose receptor regulating Gpa2-domain-containing protein n=1 Tax=Lineolata rhizophorae TaxID=578093 RepID=A0A6A6P8L9_9PEZI|nr:G protein-coupled glucose receptor regulating Gpa2-domain-containing protein [Lineolata rhizophorae]